MEHSSKMAKKHRRNPTFAGFSVCGIGGPGLSGRIRLVDDWAKVNCGNCHACAVSAEEPLPSRPEGEAKQLYQDATSDYVTIWELEVITGHPTRMWPLSARGQRLPVNVCPTYRQVEDSFGPLTPVSEYDLLMRYLRSLEELISEGNM